MQDKTQEEIDKKWSYLPTYLLIKNYIYAGHDFALIGPSKTGKSELLRDLTRDNERVCIVSCLRNSEPRRLEENVAVHLLRSLNLDEPVKNPSFIRLLEHLYIYQGQVLVSDPIVLMLENVESVLMTRNRQFYYFFDQLMNFVKELREVITHVKIQIIIVSRIDVSLEVIKVPMPLPSSEWLRQHVVQRYRRRVETIENKDVRQQCEALEPSFIANLMSFDVTRRDFEIYDILVTVLLREMMKGIKNARVSELRDADTIADFKNSLKVLNSNIETAYMPADQFRERVNAAISVGTEKIDQIKMEMEWEVRNRDLEKTLNKLPETAAILLIAFYIQSHYMHKEVGEVLGTVKRSNRRKMKAGMAMPDSNRLRVIESKKHQRKRRIEMDRVIMTAKQVMKNISEYIKTPEKRVEYCSLNMALNFDFLENRGWISKLIERNGKVYYHFLGDEKTIKVLLSERFPVLGDDIIKVSAK